MFLKSETHFVLQVDDYKYLDVNNQTELLLPEAVFSRHENCSWRFMWQSIRLH